MAMGTNDQSQARTRPQTRSSKRDVLIYGFAGVMFALVLVMALPTADTWYLILGVCVIAIMAVVYVAKAIIALRRDDASSSGSNDIPDHGAFVKVQDGATYTVVKRSSPGAGQRSRYWLGDNGKEIELTHDEAARLS
jgi:hypothetical protein